MPEPARAARNVAHRMARHAADPVGRLAVAGGAGAIVVAPVASPIGTVQQLERAVERRCGGAGVSRCGPVPGVIEVATPVIVRTPLATSSM